MEITKIAKAYNTLRKHINETCGNGAGENKYIYKVKNKFYFMNEKTRAYNLLCELDSYFLESMNTNFKENCIFEYSKNEYEIENELKEQYSQHVFAIFDFLVAEIDRQDLLENSFFTFCINEIEKDNRIVYNETISKTNSCNIESYELNELENNLPINTKDSNKLDTTECNLNKANSQDFHAENSIIDSNKALHNTESNSMLSLKTKIILLESLKYIFDMKQRVLYQKAHKSYMSKTHINHFRIISQIRLNKIIITKERSPPK